MESTNLSYSFFAKKDFEELANIHDTCCISIYIPTKRVGKEVDEGQGQLQLKNCMKKIRDELKQCNCSNGEIENYLKPIDLLLEDTMFWRNQLDGLAIFLNKKEMWYYSLPLPFKKYTYVSDHFYLLPLIPIFNGDGKYYLLNLSQGRIQFFEGSRHSIKEIMVDDLLPENLEEAIGDDYPQKNLQFRSGGGKENAVFHGHGAGKDSFDKEIEKFFRSVDDGLMELIRHEKYPLIIACQDQYYPTYKKINSYAYLFGQHISTNPEQEDVRILHEKAWLLVKDFFQQYQKNKVKEFRDLNHFAKASSELEKIIRAAVDGRVDSLFILITTEINGLYDLENRSVIIDEAKSINNASLINLAAVKSFMQGAKVYLVYSEEMPLKGTSMNAIFRY